jgi:hypothetical protein
MFHQAVEYQADELEYVSGEAKRLYKPYKLGLSAEDAVL